MILNLNRFVILIILLIHFSFSQVNTEAMRDEDFEKSFSNQIKLDFGYQTSQDEIFDLWLSGNSNYYLENNLHAFLVLNYQNGFISDNAKKEVFLNRGFAHLRFTKTIYSKLEIELFFQVGFNDFILIKDRRLFGSGIRKSIIKKENLKSYIGLGMMRELEKYDFIENSSELLTRQTSYSTITYLVNNNISFNSILYFQPSVNDVFDFRLLSENEMHFKINDKFSITMSIDYRYDNEPHGKSKKSYLQINNGFEFDL